VETRDLQKKEKILKFVKHGRENKTFIQIQIQLEEYGW